VSELYDDEQVVANGYLGPAGDGGYQLVAPPAQFDETPVRSQHPNDWNSFTPAPWGCANVPLCVALCRQAERKTPTIPMMCHLCRLCRFPGSSRGGDGARARARVSPLSRSLPFLLFSSSKEKQVTQM